MKLLLIIIMTLLAVSRQACNEEKKTKKEETPQQERVLAEERSVLWDEASLVLKRYSDGSLEWNEAALKAATHWKSDTVAGENSSIRNELAKIFDQDPSILAGLSRDELIDFLGPSESSDAHIQYRYDRFYDENDDYLGCWLTFRFNDDSRVEDVLRVCP